ncbi:MAG: hypothetical protein HY716_08390 [Planctomycetes bacterium]|nr:hypothetical protein [Planctomycetota bacterium]
MKNKIPGGGAVAALLIAIGAAMAAPQGQDAGNRYIGVDKCKNCHEAKTKGSQFSRWKETKHAKAFELLTGDEAKKVAQAKGISDPHKSEKCLKCHVTAFGQPAERLAKGFEPTHGIQCESCHGPGEKHFKVRLAAAEDEEEGYVEIPDGEIIKSPPLKTCLGCHNEESPQFKPFCFKKRFSEIQHWDPRKERSEAEIKAAQCACPADGCTCKQGECGELHEKK